MKPERDLASQAVVLERRQVISGIEARLRFTPARQHSLLRFAPSEGWRRGRESNPRIAVLQTAALPLGYPAVSGS
jgi:hypothetical protein